MTGIDELKLAYAETNPDTPSDTKTMAFHSTPQPAQPPRPPAIRPKTDRRMPGLRLTTSLPYSVPTPVMISLLAWLTVLILAVAATVTQTIHILPVLTAAIMSAIHVSVRPVYRPTVETMMRRFRLTIVDAWTKPGERGLHVRFLDTDGVLHDGRLVLTGRHATIFDTDGQIMTLRTA